MTVHLYNEGRLATEVLAVEVPGHEVRRAWTYVTDRSAPTLEELMKPIAGTTIPSDGHESLSVAIAATACDGRVIDRLVVRQRVGGRVVRQAFRVESPAPFSCQ